MGAIKGDTRSLDYSSHGSEGMRPLRDLEQSHRDLKYIAPSKRRHNTLAQQNCRGIPRLSRSFPCWTFGALVT